VLRRDRNSSRAPPHQHFLRGRGYSPPSWRIFSREAAVADVVAWRNENREKPARGLLSILDNSVLESQPDRKSHRIIGGFFLLQIERCTTPGHEKVGRTGPRHHGMNRYLVPRTRKDANKYSSQKAAVPCRLSGDRRRPTKSGFAESGTIDTQSSMSDRIWSLYSPATRSRNADVGSLCWETEPSRRGPAERQRWATCTNPCVDPRRSSEGRRIRARFARRQVGR